MEKFSHLQKVQSLEPQEFSCDLQQILFIVAIA